MDTRSVNAIRRQNPMETPTLTCQPEKLSVKGAPSVPIAGRVPCQGPSLV